MRIVSRFRRWLAALFLRLHNAVKGTDADTSDSPVSDAQEDKPEKIRVVSCTVKNIKVKKKTN